MRPTWPYTDVILAFLVVNGNLNVHADGGAFDSNLQSNMRTLQNAGKNVLVSFGGDPSTFPSSAWQSCAQNVYIAVNNIAAFVKNHGFNGVDIDYEDDNGFTGVYDGVGFLIAVTSGLAKALPGYIITHAPQTPYWDPKGGYGDPAPYLPIWHQVGVNNQIMWFNNRFYSNKGYDQDAPTKQLWYRNIAEGITGPQRLLVGALLGPGEGYITIDDMVQNVITPLKSRYGPYLVVSWVGSFH
jgi:chitinase